MAEQVITVAKPGTFATTYQVRDVTHIEYADPAETQQLTAAQKFWKWLGITLLGFVIGYGVRWLVGLAARAVVGPAIAKGLEWYSLYARYRDAPILTYLEERYLSPGRYWRLMPTLDGEVASPFEFDRWYDLF